MFGWLTGPFNRLVVAMYKRGQALVEAEHQIGDERRSAIRTVREAISEAMTLAEDDREHGDDKERKAAIAAANRASATVHEVDDDEARTLVAEWKSRFDAIQKGWKEGGHVDAYSERRFPPGYPEPAWSELRQAANTAQAQLGEALRGLMSER